MVRQDEHVVEGVVLEVREEESHRVGVVSVRGARVRVWLDLIENVAPGDRILFHGRIGLALLERKRKAEP